MVFLGRIDEPRKGLTVLLDALPELVRRVPDVRLLVAGPGDVDQVRRTWRCSCATGSSCSGW